MRIFSRYILKEIIGFFAVAILAFTAILLTLRMLRFAALIVHKGVLLSQIFEVFIAIIPTFLEFALPLSALLGVMLAIARLSGDSEIIVMRGSGISLYQLLWPIAAFGAAITVFALIVSHELKPWGHRKLARAFFELARSKTTSGLEEGIFNRLGEITLYCEKIDYLTGSLSKVLIDDRRDKQLRKIISAHRGKMYSDETHRTINIELRDGYIHEIVDGNYVLTDFNVNHIALAVDELFEVGPLQQGKSPGELSSTEIREVINFYRDILPRLNDAEALELEALEAAIPEAVARQPLTREAALKRLRRMEMERQQRFSLPFAALFLALLGLPLGVQPPRAQRTWGAGISVALGMLVFVSYYALFSLAIIGAQNGLLPAFVALWIPNLCVLLVAVMLIRRTASEAWQSIAHGFELTLVKLLGKRRWLQAA